jgi:hemerythrin-like domain-containing protein
MYAEELLRDIDKIFLNYNEGDSISNLLEENEELATLTGDLEEVIEAMENLDNSEIYTKEIKRLNYISQGLDFDNIEGKEDFKKTLNKLIGVVKGIEI